MDASQICGKSTPMWQTSPSVLRCTVHFVTMATQTLIIHTLSLCLAPRLTWPFVDLNGRTPPVQKEDHLEFSVLYALLDNIGFGCYVRFLEVEICNNIWIQSNLKASKLPARQCGKTRLQFIIYCRCVQPFHGRCLADDWTMERFLRRKTKGRHLHVSAQYLQF